MRADSNIVRSLVWLILILPAFSLAQSGLTEYGMRNFPEFNLTIVSIEVLKRNLIKIYSFIQTHLR